MKPSRRGRFIVLEGGEGAGKSTHARFVCDWLEARGRQTVLTREPGGSPLAEGIHAVFDRGLDGHGSLHLESWHGLSLAVAAHRVCARCLP